jgi:hypothetical protein
VERGFYYLMFDVRYDVPLTSADMDSKMLYEFELVEPTTRPHIADHRVERQLKVIASHSVIHTWTSRVHFYVEFASTDAQIDGSVVSGAYLVFSLRIGSTRPVQFSMRCTSMAGWC